jgi:hypothetical protein
MTIHIVDDAGGRLGSLQMSARNARAFLTDLRNGCSPTVAKGDEDGVVEIGFEITKAGRVVLIRKPNEQDVLHRSIIDWGFDLKITADELLADLGA